MKAMTSGVNSTFLHKAAKRFSGMYLFYALSVVGFLLLWDVAVTSGWAGKFLPRPLEVLDQLIGMWGMPIAGKTLLQHLWASLSRVLLGFLIAVGVGVPIGLAMGFNRYARAVISPIFNLFKTMPPIAWISLAILWLGIGEASKVFIIFIGAVIPVVINTFNGIRLVDPELYDVIHILGASKKQELIEVTFPASFPAIFAGMQIALSMAWTTVLAAELVGAREGMGFIIVTGMNLSKPAMIVAGMVVIAITAVLITGLLNLLERQLTPWKVDVK